MTSPRAFSYIRFSSAKQAAGDSLRRQTEAARDYAEGHGLELADLTLHDLGVSAFKGKNADEGALGEFIKAAKVGKIERGSWLLVESLDRLSRDSVRPARDLFESILDCGIHIVTLKNSKHYDPENYDIWDMFESLLEMKRANEESKLKGERVGAAWKRKKDRAREVGEITTRSVPHWLRATVDAKGRRTVEVDARKAKVVRRIFGWAADGWGTQRIARQLNADKVTVFGRSDGWRESYIRLILKNAAVIGHYQPMKNTEAGERIPDGDPREGYFPAVVEPALFYKVKHTRAGPSGVANRRGDDLPRNLLAGLVFCAKCGGPRHYVSKGRNNVYLDCDNRRRKGTCDAPAVRYRDVFAGVMEQLQDIRPIEGNDHAARERDLEIDKLDGEVAEAREAVEALLDNMTRSTSPRLAALLDAKEAALETMEARREELKAEAKAAAEKQVAAMRVTPPAETVYEQIEGADTPWIIPGPGSDRTLVYHIIAEVRRLVERVEVVKGEPIKIIPKG